MFKKIIFNKYFAICFIFLIIAISGLSSYHMYNTQKVLNSDPIKVYKVPTDNREKPMQPTTVDTTENIKETNVKKKSKVGVEINGQNKPVLVLENLDNLQGTDLQDVLTKLSKGLIDTTGFAKTENNFDSISNPLRKETREEAIERMVAAGMPRDQAERMRPYPPGVFDINAFTATYKLSSLTYGTKDFFDAFDEVLDLWAISSDPSFKVPSNFIKREIDGKPATQWEIYQHKLITSSEK